MDFTGRSQQPAHSTASAPQAQHATPQSSSASSKNGAGRKSPRNLGRWGSGILGLLILALFVAVIFAISFGNKNGESKLVDDEKLQAVFLQTGQVYFGNVTELNSKYFVLNNIYYLQTGNTEEANAQANANVSLVKLGCELHSPFDQMIINRDQVTFWENLHEDGQVAKAVATFQKDNPDGQKCTDQSAAPNTDTNVQGSGTGTTGTGTQNQTTTGNN